MSKIYFSFYIILLFVCIIFAGLGEMSLELQLIISLIFITLIGIPHGAIDHLLVKQEGIKKPLRFYTFYLGMLILNLIIWFTFPLFGLIAFLFISAYHFGQSQFSSLNINNPILSRILYLMWGIAILAGLVFYNINEVSQIIAQSQDLSSFLILPSEGSMKLVLVSSSIMTVLILGIFFLKGQIKFERLLTEVLFFGLIQVCFFLLPILIGFTLYFIILHSLKVLIEEYEYLKSIKEDLGMLKFIIQLLPYTLLSIIGGVFLLFLNLNGILFMSAAFVLLVLISSITLPHSIVMEGFYHHGSHVKSNH